MTIECKVCKSRLAGQHPFILVNGCCEPCGYVKDWIDKNIYLVEKWFVTYSVDFDKDVDNDEEWYISGYEEVDSCHDSFVIYECDHCQKTFKKVHAVIRHAKEFLMSEEGKKWSKELEQNNY